jgi:hypothetical protein
MASYDEADVGVMSMEELERLHPLLRDEVWVLFFFP